MTFETALVRRLLDAATVAEPTSGRIDWMRRPNGSLPAITLQTVSDPRPQHFKGFQSTRPTRVQIDVWAARPGDAVQLRNQVIATLAPADVVEGVGFQRAMIADVRPGFETDEAASEGQPAGEIYREIIDIIFTHNAN